ncbi:T9SS type A sorting domain-containing protein [Aquimarina rhabdastrellae]
MSKKLFLAIVLLCSISFAIHGQTLNELSGTGSGINITTGDFNTMFGDSTGTAVTSQHYNTLIGYRAGRHNRASENVFIGYNTGYTNTTGFDNTFIGMEAGRLNTNGGDNTFIGAESGENNTTGYDNTFYGEESGTLNTTGYENTFIGEDAGLENTTGYKNTFIGNESGSDSDTGYRNTGVGNKSLRDIDEGHHNTAVGDSSAIDLGKGLYNTVIGAAAGVAIEYADFNTFIGAMAGWDNNRTNSTTNANRNTYVGFLSGASNRDGEDNAGFGAYSGYGRANSTTAEDDEFTHFNGNINRSRTTFFGSQAIAAQNDVITMGYYSYNEGQYAIGIGNEGNMQNAVGAIVIGHNFETTDNSDYSVGLGYQANIAQSYSIGIGSNVTIDNIEAIGIGANTVVQNNGAIVIGTGAQSNDINDNSSGDATNNIAIGYNAVVSAENAIAIGNGATATNSNTMVLGGVVNPVSVGIGTDTPSNKASLELADTDKGLLLNRLTNSQRSSLKPGSANEGLMVYDTEDDMVYTWNGDAWTQVTSTGDNLGNHKATTNLGMNNKNITSIKNIYLNSDNYNGIYFNSNSNDFSITVDDRKGNYLYEYGTVKDAFGNNHAIVKFNTSSSTGAGWVWGVTNERPIAALDNKGKLQLASGLNIGGNYEFPITDGAANQVLVSDGAGSLSWTTQIDNQELSLTTNTLGISGGTGTVDLSGYLDNTDNQELSLTTNTLGISGGTGTVDLSGYLDNTDNQELSLTTNTLGISGGAGTVDLSGYLDNTDNQELSLTTNILGISGGVGTVDLSGYLDNTDNQELSFSNNILSISGGTNTIDFSSYVSADDQNLTSANLSDTDLTIGIENGTSVSVDLSPMLTAIIEMNTNQQNTIVAQQQQINDLISRIEVLEDCACTLSVDDLTTNPPNQAILYQNIPNPFNGTSAIKYYIPIGIAQADMVFSNTSGQIVSSISLDKRGENELNINRDGLASGVYFYTLFINGHKIDTKKMIIE